MMPNPLILFHFTAIKNLSCILKTGSIRCTNLLKNQNITYVSIANNNVQEKRAKKHIPNTAFTLHDYVPFMFAPRSPMMYVITQGNVPDAQERNSDNLIYFVVDFENIKNMDYIFTDYHPIVGYANFYTMESDLDKIQWDLLREEPSLAGYCKYFQKEDEPVRYMRRPEARQAELLIKKELPLDKISYIAVKNDTVKKRVEEILKEESVSIKVITQEGWYF